MGGGRRRRDRGGGTGQRDEPQVLLGKCSTPNRAQAAGRPLPMERGVVLGVGGAGG